MLEWVGFILFLVLFVIFLIQIFSSLQANKFDLHNQVIVDVYFDVHPSTCPPLSNIVLRT